MKLYITRHGKTLWNKESRFQGWLDSPLSSEGLEDAKALSLFIKEIEIHHIYSSPLKRAYDTAKIIYPHRLVLKDERLKEMNFGIFEGQQTSFLIENYGELYDALWNHPEHFDRIENGESYEEVQERVRSFLSECYCRHKDENVLIVVHGMYFIVLLGLLRGYSKKDYVKINRHVTRGCSLTCIEMNDNEVIEHYIGLDTYLKHESIDSYLIKK